MGGIRVVNCVSIKGVVTSKSFFTIVPSTQPWNQRVREEKAREVR